MCCRKDTALKCYLESRHENGEAITYELMSQLAYIYYQKSIIWGYLQVSSDSKLLCASLDTCSYGCLEIKCPYSIGIDGSLTTTLTPNETAEKYGKSVMHKGEDGLLYLLYDYF